MKISTLIFAVILPVLNTVAQQNVISKGAVWKYHDQGDVGTTNWVNNNFDDSAWATGNAELGYGDGDETTVVSFGGNSSNKHITTYFRKSINLSELRGLNCKIKMDDGAVVYLNGNEVYRNGMPAGSISFSTTANSTIDENAWYTFTIPMNLTLVGQNTFAVEIHQASPSSSDISFDFEVEQGNTDGVYINEVLSSNDGYGIDETGESQDWIELYNNNSTNFDLTGYYITDDIEDKTKHQLPSSLSVPANGRLILWASGNTSISIQHLNFKVSSEGEWLGLYAPDGVRLVDSLRIPDRQRLNVSYGRETDGSSKLRYFQPPSFNQSNNINFAYLGILSPLDFSEQSGFFASNFSLSITSKENATIYYTDDSSEPSKNNLSGSSYSFLNSYPEIPGQGQGPFINRSFRTRLYNNSLQITDRTGNGEYAYISSTYDYSPNYFPSQTNKKIQTIKAYASRSGYLDSDVSAHNFIVNGTGQNPSQLPIIFLQASPEDLFDHNSGLYVAGSTFLNWRAANPTTNALFNAPGNWNVGAEKKAHIQMIEGNKVVLNQYVGIKIAGAGSRAFRTKSVRLVTRKEYGINSLDYKFFPNEQDSTFNSIVFRNSGSNYLSSPTYMKDGAFHLMIRGLNTEFQRFRPAIFYLNGEYWGMLNIRDRLNNDYYENKYGVPESEFEGYEHPFKQNWSGHYDMVKNFIQQNDMSGNSNYNQATTLIDVDNYIDYIIIESFVGNTDWPHNNLTYWRKNTPFDPNAPIGQDGRWRWAIYDLDLGSLTANPYSKINSFDLFYRNLKQNQTFKHKFINRYADLLNSYFLHARTVAIVDSIKNHISAEMANHIDRWKYPSSINSWLTSVNDFKTALTNRKATVINSTLTEFNIPSDYDLTVNVSNQTAGYVHVNSIDIIPSTPGINQNPYPWTGEYFDNIPLKIHARPNIGYKFKHWEYNGTTLTDSVLIINTSSSVSYKAIFEEDLVSENPLPVAFDVDKCGYQFKFWDEDANDGTFPVSMAFVYMDEEDPTLSANIAGFTSGDYNNNSRTRVNGLNGNGVSFINTGSERDGYPATKVGGAIMSLRTIGYDSLKLSFTAGTITSNSREYNLRLQYRIGDKLPFTDLLDDNNQIVEYTRSPISGEEQQFEVKLPDTILDKPFVQLFWRYYYTGTRNSEASGARDEIRLDDVKIQAKLLIDQPVTVSAVYDKYGEITAGSNIDSNTNLTLEAGRSIIIKPGFSTNSQTIFTAIVTGCPE